MNITMEVEGKKAGNSWLVNINKYYKKKYNSM